MQFVHEESLHQAVARLSYQGTSRNSRVTQHDPQSLQIIDAEFARKIIYSLNDLKCFNYSYYKYF